MAIFGDAPPRLTDLDDEEESRLFSFQLPITYRTKYHPIGLSVTHFVLVHPR
ncbi:hypothetical protein BT96DRAFT_924984 [Gymnopus androsaceus JB14]|uniref:Uncharacterized protein n=1 Tax=Gymnopus androsaceus JB14 TaxID=1447944 RepID=A0A6A4H175_9AGAR|nr:hypothetical protein BT96DRAFT_924984 [Gymnopus androsaceus JB14]